MTYINYLFIKKQVRLALEELNIYLKRFQRDLHRCSLITGDEQYRGAGGSSSGSPPASLLVVPQPLTVKPSHPSHLNPHLGGPHSHPPRKYQCKMCPQVSNRKCPNFLPILAFYSNFLTQRSESLFLSFFIFHFVTSHRWRGHWRYWHFDVYYFMAKSCFWIRGFHNFIEVLQIRGIIFINRQFQENLRRKIIGRSFKKNRYSVSDT